MQLQKTTSFAPEGTRIPAMEWGLLLGVWTIAPVLLHLFYRLHLPLVPCNLTRLVPSCVQLHFDYQREPTIPKSLILWGIYKVMIPLLWRRNTVCAPPLSCVHGCVVYALYVGNRERVEAQIPIGFKWDRWPITEKNLLQKDQGKMNETIPSKRYIASSSFPSCQ